MLADNLMQISCRCPWCFDFVEALRACPAPLRGAVTLGYPFPWFRDYVPPAASVLGASNAGRDVRRLPFAVLISPIDPSGTTNLPPHACLIRILRRSPKNANSQAASATYMKYRGTTSRYSSL